MSASTHAADPLPRPAPAPSRAARRAVLRPGRDALPAARPRQPGRSATCARPPRGRRPARRRQPRGRPGRARRGAGAPRRGRGASTRPACRRRRRSSATSSSTTSAARSSTPTCSGSGSAARPRWTPSATASSCCSRATHAPLAERLDAIAGRLEAIATLPRGGRDPGDRAAGPAAGSGSSSRPPRSCRRSSTRSSPPAVGVVPDAEQRRLERRRRRPPRSRSTCTRRGCDGTLAGGTDDWPLGRERLRRAGRACARSTASMPTRSSSSAGSSSREEHEARAAAAREIDPTPTSRRSSTGSSPTIRPTSTTPSTPTATAMLRSRQHLIDHDLVTVPDDERIDVIADARVPAQRHPVRRLLRAGDLRPRPEGHLHRDPVGRRRPERDARAQLRLDQQHEHPRGLSRPPSPARRRPAEPAR